MSQPHVAYLALGSNLGDRAAHIQRGLRAIAPFATVEATSFLYETPPAYMLDQPKFLNAVCRVTTDLAPYDLLVALKATEDSLGRFKSIRFGPRSIDLDIIFYDDIQLALPDELLIIPHPRMAERGFVLEPMNDIAPTFVHPGLGATMQELLARLNEPPLPRVMPLRDQLWTWRQKTYLMGIINVTPDSFSGDGLLNNSSSPNQLIDRAVMQAERFVADGADCLDIGGQSTRPGHQVISAEAEIERVAPVIEAVAQAVNVPISIDTFRSAVAQAALAAGASLINDVWGLAFDAKIGQIAADNQVPLVITHNRAQNDDPIYQQPLAARAAPKYGDIIQDIVAELGDQLTAAQGMGMPRWLLIADPGIGFGKTQAQHLALIQRLAELKQALPYPLLIGASRKSFIGAVLGGLPPAERDEATVALGVLALERGANILRVHDVRAMRRAARMAEAILNTAQQS